MSARFGRNKLLQRLSDGRRVAEAAAANLLEALPLSLAVIRPGDDELAAILRSLGIGIVACPTAQLGMGHSLAYGVAQSTEADGWVIALADMPYVRSDTLRRIVLGLHTGAAMVAPYYAGRRGHPVAFGSGSLNDLLTLNGDVGARRIVQRHLDKIYRIAVDDPGILRDIDTPADLDQSLLSPA